MRISSRISSGSWAATAANADSPFSAVRTWKPDAVRMSVRNLSDAQGVVHDQYVALVVHSDPFCGEAVSTWERAGPPGHSSEPERAFQLETIAAPEWLRQYLGWISRKMLVLIRGAR